MKFTCENCGAQYLIADSKLGERGVKVRCKKCSYVIILRPSGWTADQRKDAREEAPQSADIDPSPANERPTIAAREARERDALADGAFSTGDVQHEIAVAPDIGLSQEFAALGFQENESGVLDSSPFAARLSGGSLDDLPRFSFESSGEHANDRANSDETEVVLGKRNHLGASMPNIEDDRIGDSTHVDRIASSEEDTPLERESGTGELNAALAKVQRNELLEMRSHLESDLEGLSSALDPRAKKVPQEPATTLAPRPENHRPNLQSLNALADSAEDPNYNIMDEARAEAEIGNAFEAMFGAEPSTGDGLVEPGKLPTRVFDTEAMEKVEAEQAIARPSAKGGQVSEWYVAIDDNQVGPLTLDEVVDRWESGELAADSLCWKQGLPDWQPIKLTVELRAHLGSMEDRERTVVASISEEDSVPGGAVPPQISIHPDPSEREHSMAARSGSVVEAAIDEPSWRPSAASALASLAAEELSTAASSAGIAVKNNDVAVGAAMPATSDALEKLLAGDAHAPAASAFGAAEKSESSVRPLPRRAEAITSIPLRDPAASRSRSSLMLPLSIVGAALILAGGGYWALAGKDKPAAGSLPQPEQMQVAMVAGGNPQSAETPPAETVKAPEPPATEAKAVEAKTSPPPEAAAKTDEKEDEEAEDDPDDKEAKKKKGSKKKKTEKQPEKQRREKRELVDSPAPPPPTRRASSETNEVDDLLEVGGSPRGKRPSEREALPVDDVPRQLDDSDILGVLRKNRKAIIDCVKKQTAADASVSGTMNVNMVITKAGQSTRITVSPDRYSKTVAGKCVMSAVKSWKFPKFSGPNMPIDFPVRIR